MATHKQGFENGPSLFLRKDVGLLVEPELIAWFLHVTKYSSFSYYFPCFFSFFLFFLFSYFLTWQTVGWESRPCSPWRTCCAGGAPLPPSLAHFHFPLLSFCPFVSHISLFSSVNISQWSTWLGSSYCHKKPLTLDSFCCVSDSSICFLFLLSVGSCDCG